jgi:hypothetical protein
VLAGACLAAFALDCEGVTRRFDFLPEGTVFSDGLAAFTSPAGFATLRVLSPAKAPQFAPKSLVLASHTREFLNMNSPSMINPNSLNLGEQVAVDFLARHGLRCERFTEHEMHQGKTPDFRVFKDKKFVLYCEAKHVQEDTWLDEQLDAAKPGTIVGGLRSDPIFNRLSAHVHKAAKQFEAVNLDRKFPNVLVFTNSDDLCTIQDLISVLTGNFYAESGSVDPIYKQISEGRIKYEKHTIDLYVWHNDSVDTKYKEQMFWNEGSKHYQALCSLLGTDPSRHAHIPLS